MTNSENLPTYAQIAAKAGVSTKTVCNVFINPGVVRKKTMDRVLKVLPHFGVTDPSVMKTKRRLAGPGNQKTLIFLEDVKVAAMSAPVFAAIVRAAETHAHSLGWQLLVRHKRERSTLEENIGDFRGHGVILFGNSTSYAELSNVFPAMPAVRLLAPPSSGPDCDNVDYNRALVSTIAAKHLKDSGCKKVAYIGEQNLRGELFVEECRKLDLECINGATNDIFISDGTTQTVNRAALEKSWNSVKGAHPDGLFAHSDQMANALYQILSSEGIKPMTDVKIVSCNAEQLWLAPLNPPPSTIDIHSDELGRRAVETILWRMKNKSAPLSTVILTPTLVPSPHSN